MGVTKTPLNTSRRQALPFLTMKSAFINLFSCCLFLNYFALSQAQTPSSSTIDGRSYGVLEIQKSLPEFPPLRKRLLSEVRSAAIPLGDTLGRLFICFGRDAKSTLHYYFLHKRADGATYSTLDMNQIAPDTLRSTLDVRLWRDRQTPFPLDLRIVSSRNELLYRWLLSPAGDSTAGGRPTPADVPVDVGKPFPDLSLIDLQGREFYSKSLRGKPAIINWWATWCTACIDEMPGLDSLVSVFGQRVSFLAVAQNSNQEVVRFLKDHRFRFHHTVENDTTVRTLGAGVPRTFVLNADGTIQVDCLGGGPETYKQIEQAVNAVLRQ